MNYFTLALGIFALGYGIFSCVCRFVKPEWFKKLEPMKEQWGKVAGNIIHFISYVIVPLALGSVFIFMAMNGISILDI
ncbi:MAG: hypothetical protein IKZ04_05330 [Spirochaetaceae bacterium]|nr:hypothetical protein [Spirochaetaceae bacterium]